jgi:hypothetical protein
MVGINDMGDFFSKHAPDAIEALRALARIAANENSKPEDRERAREQLEARLTEIRSVSVLGPSFPAQLEDAVRKSRDLPSG